MHEEEGEAEMMVLFYIDEFRKPNIPCYAYVAIHTGVSVNIWCVGNKSFWRDCKLNLCLGGGTPFCSDTYMSFVKVGLEVKW